MKLKQINWKKSGILGYLPLRKLKKKFEDKVLLFLVNISRFFYQQQHQKFSYDEITHGNYF